MKMKGEDIFKGIKEIDRVIHEPARLAIMAVLYGVEEADFKYLLTTTGLSKGNLSAHVAKLEEAGYVNVVKKFIGKKPATIYSMTERGREVFRTYLEFIGRLSSEL